MSQNEVCCRRAMLALAALPLNRSAAEDVLECNEYSGFNDRSPETLLKTSS